MEETKTINEIANRLEALCKESEECIQRLINLIGETLTTPTVWSPGNLNADGTFAKPGEPGGLFTFKEAQRACPDGWRLPTVEEFKELCKQESDWTGNGWRFANGLFLPAAGYRSISDTVYYVGTYGYYWSSTTYDSSYGHSLYFDSTDAYPVIWGSYALGFSVRCVKI